eukprot:GHVT01105043.1.p1 GENE.GHVT01105043.1~~GHVT01105043.1.p1  ORF type:complete len:532 (+),score=83.20 GHVT01105043.1:1824-3419(+)
MSLFANDSAVLIKNASYSPSGERRSAASDEARPHSAGAQMITTSGRRDGPMKEEEAVVDVPADCLRGGDNVDVARLNEFLSSKGMAAKAGEDLPHNQEDECVQPKHRNLQEVTSTVVVERLEGQEHLVAVKTWEELQLPDALLQGVFRKGYRKPSKIQEEALPLLIGSNNDFIGQAQNGSGKTATFALAILCKIDPTNTAPQALCVAPTRELAMQNGAVMGELGHFTKTTIFLAVARCARYDSSQIVCGTPGKMLDLLKRRSIPTEDIRVFVLDEADEMIDPNNNMGAQVQNIRAMCPRKVQVLLFSATFPPAVRTFADELIPRGGNRITVRKELMALKSIRQFYAICQNEGAKTRLLFDLYATMVIGQSVIFVNSRRSAFELALQMQDEGHSVSLLCGTQAEGQERMEHEMRDRIMAEFRSGITKVLICTDVLARGIDVPQVTLVVNYDLPLDFRGRGTEWVDVLPVNMETYIHRIGRTGRFGLAGIAISFIGDWQIDLIESIRQFYGCSIDELPTDPEDVDRMVRNLRK